MIFGFGMGGMETRLEMIAKGVADRFDQVTYLEIGVGEGATLTAIATILRDTGKKWRAVGIELPNGYSFSRGKTEHIAKIRGLDLDFVSPNGTMQRPPWDRVTVYLKDSQTFLTEMWQEPLQFALIDGCHGRSCVRLDFLGIEAWMEPGGVAMFHDYSPEQTGQYQPHCPNGIEVRAAVNDLGLIGGKRKGWRMTEVLTADRTQDGWDMAVFQKE